MALLDEKAFLSLNKPDMYKIYIDISKKLQKKGHVYRKSYHSAGVKITGQQGGKWSRQ